MIRAHRFQPVHDQCVPTGWSSSVTGVTAGRDAFRNIQPEIVEIFIGERDNGEEKCRSCGQNLTKMMRNAPRRVSYKLV